MELRPTINQFKENLKLILRNDQFYIGLFERAYSYFQRIERFNGLTAALKMAKEVLRLTSRYFLDQETGKQLGPFWLKTNKSGIPRHLRLRGIKGIKNDPTKQRLVLTVLSYYKMIVNKPDDNISTIISPQKSSNIDSTITDIKSYIPQILKELRISSFNKSDRSPIHVTTKAGANGPKAMGRTSILDLEAILNEGVIDNVISLSSLVYTEQRQKELLSLIDSTKKLIDHENPSTDLKGLRLHFIAEGGGKTRCICIGDI